MSIFQEHDVTCHRYSSWNAGLTCCFQVTETWKKQGKLWWKISRNALKLILFLKGSFHFRRFRRRCKPSTRRLWLPGAGHRRLAGEISKIESINENQLNLKTVLCDISINLCFVSNLSEVKIKSVFRCLVMHCFLEWKFWLRVKVLWNFISYFVWIWISWETCNLFTFKKNFLFY